MIWEEWGGFAKLGLAAFLVLCGYSVFRDSAASSLVDSSTAALKNQAKVIAHLSPKQAGEASVRKFIKEQQGRSLEVKQLSQFAKMNSALDILRKVSESVPDRSHNGILVSRFNVNDQRVEIEGSVPRQQDLAAIQSSLNALSLKGRVEVLTPRNHPSSGIPFAYGFSVDRGLVSSSSSAETKGPVIK